MLTKKFDEALLFASDLHREQTRKSTDIPYLGHLLSVAGLVLENDGDEIQAISALLHDAIEDQAEVFGPADALGDEIEKRFGLEVRQIVEACSDSTGGPKGEWEPRKLAYIAQIQQKSSRIALVSVADKVHNARSIVADLRRIGVEVFDRFTGGREGTIWYYSELSRTFNEFHPSFLATELERLVVDMNDLVRKITEAQ